MKLNRVFNTQANVEEKDLFRLCSGKNVRSILWRSNLKHKRILVR